MPMYSFECVDHLWDEIRTVEDRDTFAVCPECGRSGERILTVAAIHAFAEYADENLADKHSGEPYIVKSPASREKRRKELGLTGDAPISDRAKETKDYNAKRPVSISG